MSSSEINVIAWAISVKYVLPAIVLLVLVGLVVYFTVRRAVRDELGAAHSLERKAPSEPAGH